MSTVSVHGLKFMKSSRKDKKYMVKVGNKTVHFGAIQGVPMAQYHDKLGLYSKYDHHDKARRERYRKRHKKILARGAPAYLQKYTPAYFSMKYLW